MKLFLIGIGSIIASWFLPLSVALLSECFGVFCLSVFLTRKLHPVAAAGFVSVAVVAGLVFDEPVIGGHTKREWAISNLSVLAAGLLGLAVGCYMRKGERQP